jgi:uncharacterized protein (TIGR02466 family)
MRAFFFRANDAASRALLTSTAIGATHRETERMEKRIWKLFPTLVHYYTEVLAPSQLKSIVEYCVRAESSAVAHDAFLGAAVSSHDRRSMLLDELESHCPDARGIKSGLSKLVAAYAEELGFDGVRITNSWFNIQKPGSVLKHHVHPDSRVSAALCVDADERSSKLYLENPNPFLHFIRPDRYTEPTFELAKFKLAPGDLILFPSWIKHGSGFETNESEQRIVISLNAA